MQRHLRLTVAASQPPDRFVLNAKLRSDGDYGVTIGDEASCRAL